MEFWELLTVGGTMGTILGVFLTLSAVINNRTLKEEARLTRELILRIEEGQEEFRKEFRESHEELRREFREGLEGFRKSHEENIRYIANLIVSEGERTRGSMRG